MSIIYTSHYMEEVELLCKRVAMLGGGIIQVGLCRWDNELIARMTDLPAVCCAMLVPLEEDGQAPPITHHTRVAGRQSQSHILARGKSLFEVLPSLGALLLFSAVFFWIGTRRFCFE